MHAVTILHRIFSSRFPSMHTKRLMALLAAVEAVISGCRLTLSDLGRGVRGRATVKHNIKRMDRLLGNRLLHSELPVLYEILAQESLTGVNTPLIVVDWSDLAVDRRWQLLRASVALEGRSVTLYEEVHPLKNLMARHVHKTFLKRLSALLPPGCLPILVTDAGFRGTWFNLVNQMGWHWIGRIRNRDMVRPKGEDAWMGCTSLYARATATARCLGSYQYVRSNPVSCQLVLIKRTPKGRHKKTCHGKTARSRHSLKNAHTQRDPWLLAVSPSLTHLNAQAAVAVYAQRMQIEESFRDLKSERFGLGFSTNRSTQKERLAVLLLVACLASFVLRLVGEVARTRQLEFQFQSNTRRSRHVLSVITLALQLIQRGLAAFPPRELMAALGRLRYNHPVLEI
ncbi:MAG: IS4 family transposase [Burkholderiales bacterium]